MIAADTSLVVAAFASWHENHAATRCILDKGVRLIAPCPLETYSLVTRLPARLRVSAPLAREFVVARLSEAFPQLSEAAYLAFVLGLPAQGIAGGGAHAAPVAATAAAHGAEPATCDRRALRV